MLDIPDENHPGYLRGVEAGYWRGYDAGLKKGRRDEFPAWYYAEDGEIWELTGEISRGQYIVAEHRFYLLPLLAPKEPGWTPASFSREFTSGKLIWSNEYLDENS